MYETTSKPNEFCFDIGMNSTVTEKLKFYLTGYIMSPLQSGQDHKCFINMTVSCRNSFITAHTVRIFREKYVNVCEIIQ